jgi:hypothetical protein
LSTANDKDFQAVVNDGSAAFSSASKPQLVDEAFRRGIPHLGMSQTLFAGD